MKNNKGFTLVELLAVITILSIILVIAVPNVLKTIDDTKEKARYMAAKDIVEIAAAYMEAENKCIDNSTKSTTLCKGANGVMKPNVYVDVETLCNEGYIENDAINPENEDAKNISSCSDFDKQYVVSKVGVASYGDQIERGDGYGARTTGTCHFYGFKDYQYGYSDCH